MELNEYQNLALRTMKKFDLRREQEINGLLGLAGETGEVCDMLKKHYVLGGGELNKDALVKELGDVLWYVAELCDAFDFTLEDVAKRNIQKLMARHGDEFSGAGDRTGEGK